MPRQTKVVGQRILYITTTRYPLLPCSKTPVATTVSPSVLALRPLLGNRTILSQNTTLFPY
jgi:hypothetical protein